MRQVASGDVAITSSKGPRRLLPYSLRAECKLPKPDPVKLNTCKLCALSAFKLLVRELTAARLYARIEQKWRHFAAPLPHRGKHLQ